MSHYIHITYALLHICKICSQGLRLLDIIYYTKIVEFVDLSQSSIEQTTFKGNGLIELKKKKG